MRLTLRPVEIPFTVGDTVWVNQSIGASNEFPYFQAIIMQIILDGSFIQTLVIRHRGQTHELIVSSAIYSVKPVGQQAGSPRVNVSVHLDPLQKNLFVTREELLDYQNQSR